jgi:single-stranded DNA-binding protein
MMNELTIKGKITFVDEVREFGSNGFRKHQVVVETGDGRWDNPIPVEFIKDSIELSKELKVGDQVQIQSRINGREWQGKDGVTKWFTSINGYKITKESPQSDEDPSSSFETFDEYADDLEEDVF